MITQNKKLQKKKGFTRPTPPSIYDQSADPSLTKPRRFPIPVTLPFDLIQKVEAKGKASIVIEAALRHYFK